MAAKLLKGSSAIALGDFRSEIEVLRKVHHPNAVQFLGACTKQEPYILVTGLIFIHFTMSPSLLGLWIAQDKTCHASISAQLPHTGYTVMYLPEVTQCTLPQNLHIQELQEWRKHYHRSAHEGRIGYS